MLPQFSDKELQERNARELEDSKRKLDLTVPGGVTVSDSGYFQNADGQYVDEKGKFVNEPVYAKDVQKRLADEKAAAADAETLRAQQEAARRAEPPAPRIKAEG